MELLFTFIILFILLLCVGFFTSSETAFLSLSKIKLRRMNEEKVRHAKIVTKLKNRIETLLTTVLIGTNFVNSLISAITTALVSKYFGGDGVGFPTFIVAFFITTFGQIIPKTIAGRKPEKITCRFSVPLSVLQTILFPIVWLFERLSHSAVWLTQKITKTDVQLYNEEDLLALIDVGENEGTIEKSESRMLNKLIKFNDLLVSDIMKHRTFVSSVNSECTYKQVKEEFLRSGFSTITVYSQKEENVVGIINYKKMLTLPKEIDLGKNFAFRIMSDVDYIPSTLTVLELLQKLRVSQNKFCVVLNEQGETFGIVTMEDILRIVFGRMTDENSINPLPPEERIQVLPQNTFIVPGDLQLDDFNSILNCNLTSKDMNTIAGWLLEQFGYLPISGSVYIFNHIVFTVESVFQRRITSIKIKK